jgi:hexokinase
MMIFLKILTLGKFLFYRFEKMVAGMYLGELTRVIFEDLARQGLLFGGEYDAISQPGCFPTKFLSEIERYLVPLICVYSVDRLQHL